MTSDRSAQIPIDKSPAGDATINAMTETAATADDALAAAAKRAHAQSLEHLSPRVRAQLALRRREALTPARRPQAARWWPALAAGSVAVMALAIGLRLQPPPQPLPGNDTEDLAAVIADLEAPVTPMANRGDNSGASRHASNRTDNNASRGTNNATDDATGFGSLDEAPLDESPDLYLWLASDEADVLTEETP